MTTNTTNANTTDTTNANTTDTTDVNTTDVNTVDTFLDESHATFSYFDAFDTAFADRIYRAETLKARATVVAREAARMTDPSESDNEAGRAAILKDRAATAARRNRVAESAGLRALAKARAK